MDNTNLIIALGGGLLAYWFYVDGKKNKSDKIIKTDIKDVQSSAPEKLTSLSKVGGNPENEEQPIISTNNAQQPPTKIETMGRVL